MEAQLQRNPDSASLPPGWWNSLLFFAILAVYIHTLNPSLFRNDSPETITACITLGVSHPPGYPFYSLLGHVFAMAVLVGNTAMTLNFFSALLGALGACLLATNLWLVLGSSKSPYRSAAMFVGALAFAFSKNYWSNSLAAKGGIYVLQVDLELVFFYFLQRYLSTYSRGSQETTSTQRSFTFLAFLFALGLANHWPTQVLTLPALGTLMLAKAGIGTRFKWTLKPATRILALTLLVLGLYLYLPLRANQSPTLNFGAPSNWHRFFACLVRSDYSKVETMASAAPAEFSALGNKALYLSNHFLNEFNSLFLLLAALGVCGLLKRGRKRLVLFLLTLLLTTLVVNVFYLRVGPIEFWHLDDHTLTLNWILGIFGGCGMAETLKFLGALSLFKGRTALQLALCLLVVATIPALLILKHQDVNNQSREFLYRGYGITALKSMDRLATYYAESDYDYFSILYLLNVERRRPDVQLKMTTFLTENDWDSLIRDVFTGSTSLDHPIYCAFPNGDFINGYLKHCPTAHLKPFGTIIQFMPPFNSIKEKSFAKPLEYLWEKYLTPHKRTTNSINGLLLELCAHPYLNMANYLNFRADLPDWKKYYSYGINLIQEPEFQAETWEALGDADLKSKEKTRAIIEYLQAANEYRLAGITSKKIECLEKELLIAP